MPPVWTMCSYFAWFFFLCGNICIISGNVRARKTPFSYLWENFARTTNPTNGIATILEYSWICSWYSCILQVILLWSNQKILWFISKWSASKSLCMQFANLIYRCRYCFTWQGRCHGMHSCCWNCNRRALWRVRFSVHSTVNCCKLSDNNISIHTIVSLV